MFSPVHMDESSLRTPPDMLFTPLRSGRARPSCQGACTAGYKQRANAEPNEFSQTKMCVGSSRRSEVFLIETAVISGKGTNT